MTAPTPSPSYPPEEQRPALDVQSAPAAAGPVAGAHRADDGSLAGAPDSLLSSLRNRRTKMAETLFTDVRVPGWGDDPDEDPRLSIYVRCRPLRPSELDAIRDRRRKAAKGRAAAGWLDLANADVLITSCLEVWALEGEPRDLSEVSEGDRLSLNEAEGLHGAKTKFDAALADTLGQPRNSDGSPKTAVEICRYLFLHDGAVMQAANQVMTYSGIGASSQDEAEGFTAG